LYAALVVNRQLQQTPRGAFILQTMFAVRAWPLFVLRHPTAWPLAPPGHKTIRTRVRLQLPVFRGSPLKTGGNANMPFRAYGHRGRPLPSLMPCEQTERISCHLHADMVAGYCADIVTITYRPYATHYLSHLHATSCRWYAIPHARRARRAAANRTQRLATTPLRAYSSHHAYISPTARAYNSRTTKLFATAHRHLPSTRLAHSLKDVRIFTPLPRHRTHICLCLSVSSSPPGRRAA